ncbi:MAG: TetR/AcrR family transcriptional regulator [Zoogloea sp.]|nr:TetR/AcrR family transcriptional regulator [Zoogloea sp.]
MPDSDSPRHRRRKDARPSELTAAALALFVEKGFAATRLEEVAARAGVSKGTLYLYFDSKEALFKAVIQEGILPAMEEGEARFERHVDDPERVLREILYGWWELIGSTELAGIPKLMISEAQNFPEVAQFYYEHAIGRGRRLLEQALVLGMERGLFRRLDVPSTLHVLFAPVLMLSIWQQSFARCEPAGLDPAIYFDTYFDIILRGIRAEPRPGEST